MAARDDPVLNQVPDRGLVVVVEDESVIADVVRRYLTAAGFGVRICRTGQEGLAAVRADRPVAIVLDIGLPDMDGLDLCRRLRDGDDWTPVLFATARDEDVDRILGLELGGDDYLVKPFNPRERVARLRAVLRRAGGPGGAGAALRVGRVRIDPGQRRVWVVPEPGAERRDGGPVDHEVELTATEFDLLLHLARSPGRVFERAGLLSSVWGYASAAGARTVDVHVAALRAKLGDASPIRTVRGVGYAADDR
jgi:DNA-binding response OmpR family regulator